MSRCISLSEHYRARFGCKIYKLSIDAGFTCPNRDGTCGTRGCIFCGADGGSAFAARGGSVTAQLAAARARVEAKNRGGKYIAYFQSFTNTYAPAKTLEALWREALAAPDVVGLAIATRPDCLGDDVLDLLGRLAKEYPLYVELGLQTVHPASIAYIRRGYENEVYFAAVRRLRALGIHVVTHIILGLPGETPAMMVETARAAAEAGSDGVKFHLLHVLRGTDLARDWQAGKFSCLSLAEYGDILAACIEALPPETVLHRITGDGAKKDLLAPLWSADKKRVLNYLAKRLALHSCSQHSCSLH